MGGWGRFRFPFSTTTTGLLLRLRLSGLHLRLVMMALPIASLSTALRHLSLGLHWLLLIVPAAARTRVVQFPSIGVASGSGVAQLSLACVLNFVSRGLIEAAVTGIARIACRSCRGRSVYLGSLSRSVLNRVSRMLIEAAVARVTCVACVTRRCRCRGRLVYLSPQDSIVLDSDILAGRRRCYARGLIVVYLGILDSDILAGRCRCYARARIVVYLRSLNRDIGRYRARRSSRRRGR